MNRKVSKELGKISRQLRVILTDSLYEELLVEAEKVQKISELPDKFLWIIKKI